MKSTSSSESTLKSTASPPHTSESATTSISSSTNVSETSTSTSSTEMPPTTPTLSSTESVITHSSLETTERPFTVETSSSITSPSSTESTPESTASPPHTSESATTSISSSTNVSETSTSTSSTETSSFSSPTSSLTHSSSSTTVETSTLETSSSLTSGVSSSDVTVLLSTTNRPSSTSGTSISEFSTSPSSIETKTVPQTFSSVVSSHGPNRSTASAEIPPLPSTVPVISSRSTHPSSTNSRTSYSVPTSTEAPSSALPAVICHNGGTPQGSRCVCPPLFTGPRCQEVLNEIVAEVTATIKVVVEVTNWNYSSEMQDLSSNVSRTFVRAFEAQMDIFYRMIIPHFQGIKVIQLSKGSVVVRHDVLFFTPFSGFNASYNTTLHTVREHLEKSQTQCRKGMMCFNNTSAYAVGLGQEEPCRNPQIPPLLQPYYVASNVSGQLQCVSNCSVWHPDPFTCVRGSCVLQTSGPSCYCEQSDLYWYVGSRCEQSISKVGVGVGVALALAALLLLILVLAVLLCWRGCRRKGKDGGRPKGAADEENWYENESAWDADPRGPPGQSPEASSLPESEGGSRSDQTSSSGQGSFRPCLDKVDTSLQTRIARPQLTRL
ncbi:mucin-12 [Sphaerodactylus townsendi]|uniref:mucin-12 n=1 Tax=Sphaerodactylus townsendi TaxID=933632 RepID=UPI002025D72A|nr:mucin-12 [Sphaerodactylus townsendi]